jgi:hypothetical protein
MRRRHPGSPIKGVILFVIAVLFVFFVMSMVFSLLSSIAPH